jgi:hypothetical protein
MCASWMVADLVGVGMSEDDGFDWWMPDVAAELPAGFGVVEGLIGLRGKVLRGLDWSESSSRLEADGEKCERRFGDWGWDREQKRREPREQNRRWRMLLSGAPV